MTTINGPIGPEPLKKPEENSQTAQAEKAGQPNSVFDSDAAKKVKELAAQDGNETEVSLEEAGQKIAGAYRRAGERTGQQEIRKEGEQAAACSPLSALPTSGHRDQKWGQPGNGARPLPMSVTGPPPPPAFL